MAVSGIFGAKVPVVDYVLSSHKPKLYSTTSLVEICIDFEIQTDRIFYVDLRQTYLALKLEIVRDRGYETYKTNEVKKEHKEESKEAEGAGETEEEEELEEAPVPFVTHVNNISHSIFPKVEVYINKQQNYKSNSVYAHKSYISNKFKRAISEYKEVLHCEVYGYEECLDEIMDAPLSNPFFTNRMKMLSRLDSFMLYGKMGLIFSPHLNCFIQI